MSRKSRPASPPADNDAAVLYARIHALVVAARQTVARGVDLVQVRTNFEIGRHIFEHEQQGQFGGKCDRLFVAPVVARYEFRQLIVENLLARQFCEADDRNER